MNILPSIGEGGWGLFAGWIVPSAIAVVVSSLLIFPADLPVFDELSRLEAAERALVLTFASIAIGFLLSAAQTPLYAMLEGYRLWPRGLKERRRKVHLATRRRLQHDLEKAVAPRSKATGIEVALLQEKLTCFPIAEDQFHPTVLGNAIRAVETYGEDRYHLDSQTLEKELLGVAPEPVRSEFERSRVPLDFCVVTIYLLIPFGLLALISGVAQSTDRWLLLASAALAFASLPAWYWLAVSCVAGWRLSAQALVDVGRVPLAEALGLDLPDTLEEEREMWEWVCWFVLEPYDRSREVELNRFRSKVKEGEPA